MAKVTVFVADKNGDDLGLPEWKRTAGIDENGFVYIPAFVGGNENLAVILAVQDGEPICELESGHFLLRIEWLKKNFSSDVLTLKAFEKMERNVRSWESA